MLTPSVVTVQVCPLLRLYGILVPMIISWRFNINVILHHSDINMNHSGSFGKNLHVQKHIRKIPVSGREGRLHISSHKSSKMCRSDAALQENGSYLES
jgi:hypothetical protein